jgi:hypothetical protein
MDAPRGYVTSRSRGARETRDILTGRWRFNEQRISMPAARLFMVHRNGRVFGHTIAV